MAEYWKSLSHNGVCFTDPYKPDGLKVVVHGREVPLSPLAEEMAYALAKKKDTVYIQDPVFRGNFLKDFVVQLPEWARSARYEDIDFAEVFAKVDKEKAQKEGLTKEGKKALAAERKLRRDQLKEKYGHAVVDGEIVDMANYMVEPPGLFIGRGQAPFRGRWKPQTTQSDVTLNLGEDAPIPPGGWKVVHDHGAMWMAKWIDKLTGREKYVWLHETAGLNQERNKAKYEKANKIGSNIVRIRAKIEKGLTSKDEKVRQVATVCYLIDRLGMRVGDEKDADEADTVGASTLRVEHIKVDNNVDSAVFFDFLGKDSVEWHKTDHPPKAVIDNLRKFMTDKKPEERVFGDISSATVNKFLSSIVPGVTAKVFRTYHATETVENALRSKNLQGAPDLEKLNFAREANLKAAEFCNHKRTPPKTWDQAYEKKKAKVDALKAKKTRTKQEEERLAKAEADLDFYTRTKTYNLGTSMKNYIDPRVYKSWGDHVGLEWAKIYSKSLQKKFAWVNRSKQKWAEPHAEMTAVAAQPPAST